MIEETENEKKTGGFGEEEEESVTAAIFRFMGPEGPCNEYLLVPGRGPPVFTLPPPISLLLIYISAGPRYHNHKISIFTNVL